MEYLSLTEQERDEAIAEAIHSREIEHFHYNLNAANYQELLDGMTAIPDVWPENLRALRGRTRDEIIAMASSPEDADVALQIAEKDRLRKLLASEKHEREKVKTYHARLVGKFPNAQKRDAALAAVKVKREAEKAARLAAPK